MVWTLIVTITKRASTSAFGMVCWQGKRRKQMFIVGLRESARERERKGEREKENERWDEGTKEREKVKKVGESGEDDQTHSERGFNFNFFDDLKSFSPFMSYDQPLTMSDNGRQRRWMGCDDRKTKKGELGGGGGGGKRKVVCSYPIKQWWIQRVCSIVFDYLYNLCHTI